MTLTEAERLRRELRKIKEKQRKEEIKNRNKLKKEATKIKTKMKEQVKRERKKILEMERKIKKKESGKKRKETVNINKQLKEQIRGLGKIRLAELQKESGNKLFKIKQYRSALPLYTEAIKLCPNTAAYYSNRAACYMMLSNFRDALEDARKTVQIDQSFLKGYQRIVKCSLALGDLVTAEEAIKKINELDSGNLTMINEMIILTTLKHCEAEAAKASDRKEYSRAVYWMDQCLEKSPFCSRYKIQKVENLLFQEKYSEIESIVKNLIQFKKGNVDANYITGICFLYNDDIEQALIHFQIVLSLEPDHDKALDAYKRANALKIKKEAGNNAYNLCQYQDAINLYTEALNIDLLNKKTNSKLYFNRATVYSKLRKFQEAISDCNEALKLDETYVKALLRRAKCYMEVSEYENAVRDYEKACKMYPSCENEKLLQDAKIAWNCFKQRRNYYKILGIKRSATADEIKQAYRKCALIHHPDKHPNSSDIQRKEHERKFKEIGEAYAVLSDAGKKARYDNNQNMGS